MKNLLWIALCLLTTTASAQFFSPLKDRVEKTKGRILLIENEDFSCLPNAGELFKKHWALGNEVQAMSSKEIDALLTPDNASKYMVLTGDQKMEAKKSGGTMISSPVVGFVLYLGENAMIRNELNIDRKFIFKVSFPSCINDESEVQFICQHFKIYFQNPEAVNQKKTIIPIERTASVQNMTVLFPKSSTELTAAEIKKNYHFPFEIQDDNRVRKAILDKKPNCAYPNVIWSDKKFAWVTVLVSCATGEVLSTSKNSYFKATPTKRKFDPNTQFLAINRAKTKLAAYELKLINKAISNAVNPK